MPVVMSGNYIFVNPGEKHYLVASNFTNYVLLGTEQGDDYFLEARIENNEFKVNARIFDPSTEKWCVLKDNAPQKSECTRRMLPNGYEISNSNGDLLFGLRVNGQRCEIISEVHDADGELVATSQSGSLVVLKGPAVLGKSGNSRGIVLG